MSSTVTPEGSSCNACEDSRAVQTAKSHWSASVPGRSTARTSAATSDRATRCMISTPCASAGGVVVFTASPSLSFFTVRLPAGGAGGRGLDVWMADVGPVGCGRVIAPADR